MSNDIATRIAALSVDERAAIAHINERLLTMMETGEGAAILVIDVHGLGSADILCCGDATIGALLLKSAGTAYDMMYTCPKEELQ